MEVSKKPVSPNRILSVYSNRWNGSRPGIVVSGNDYDPSGVGRPVRVNVSLDGFRDRDILAAFRARPEGNTLEVLVYDRLSAEERTEFFDQADEADREAVKLKASGLPAGDPSADVLNRILNGANWERVTWAEWPQ